MKSKKTSSGSFEHEKTSYKLITGLRQRNERRGYQQKPIYYKYKELNAISGECQQKHDLVDQAAMKMIRRSCPSSEPN